jgi:hypothetical protein
MYSQYLTDIHVRHLAPFYFCNLHIYSSYDSLGLRISYLFLDFGGPISLAWFSLPPLYHIFPNVHLSIEDVGSTFLRYVGIYSNLHRCWSLTLIDYPSVHTIKLRKEQDGGS